MKKTLLVLLLCFITILSFGAVEKRIYLIIPGDISINGGIFTPSNNAGKLDKEDEYLICGMVSKGSILSIRADLVETYEYQETDKTTQLVEVVTTVSDSNAELKLAMSYKAAMNKYAVLVDENAKLDTIAKMKVVYDKEKDFSAEDLLTIDESKNRYSYNEFSGYEIKENVMIFNSVVGDQKISEPNRSRPSNILEKFEKINDIEWSGEVRINPGNPHFSMTLEDGRTITTDDLKGSLGEKNGRFVFFEGKVTYLHFKVIGGNAEMEDQNGNKQTFHSGSQYTYPSGLKWLEVVNKKGNGNGHWYISLMTEEDSSNPEEVFLIAGTGDVLEGNVNMTSGKEELRIRESNIEIDVLSDKGIEIKNIK